MWKEAHLAGVVAMAFGTLEASVIAACLMSGFGWWTAWSEEEESWTTGD